MRESRINIISDLINQASNTTQAIILTDYLAYTNASSIDKICVNDEDGLNELLGDVEPCEVVRKLHFGKYDWNDTFVFINAYGNLETNDSIKDFTKVGDIAAWLIDVATSDITDIFEYDETLNFYEVFAECFAEEHLLEIGDVEKWVETDDLGFSDLMQKSWVELYADYKVWEDIMKVDYNEEWEKMRRGVV